MKIAVGSKNPAKIEAVKNAFEKVFPQEAIEVVGVVVDSGVSSQPMSDKESIKGATNRAKKALKKEKADFGVGLEGGLQKVGSLWFDSGWMVIIDANGKKGIGSTIKMPVAEKIMKEIYTGKELGIVIDEVFGTKDARSGQGHFGLMSKNHITRISGYEHGVIAALAPFIHAAVFDAI